MITIIDILSILICTLILTKAINRLFIYGVNVYYVLLFVFYAVQVFPLITDIIYKEELNSLNPVIFKAMTDVRVALMYDLFVVSVSIILYKWAKKTEDLSTLIIINSLKNIRLSPKMTIILFIISFLPVIFALFSPNPSIYLNFAFLYKENLTTSLIDILYFNEVVSPIIYISLMAILLLYVGKKNLFSIYLLIFLTLWVSQKRAFIFFALGGILFIDLLQQRFHNNIYRFIKKTILLFLIAIGYFIIYANNTIKGIGDSGYSTYVMYGTRHYCMKTAIYDSLRDNKILDYPGQSVLFDLLFFIPRTYWENKPVMYQRYFTSYVLGRNVDDDVNKWLNLLVNVWTEFTSNFGLIIGSLIALYLIKFLVNISKDNKISYFAVTLFLSTYFEFGFEPILMWIYVFWLFTIIIKRKYIKIIKK